MSANSLIQWTDHTFNPWYGCRKVAPECENCYIVRTVPFRTRGLSHGSERVRTGSGNWRLPYRWNAQAHYRGLQYKVFCLSLGDWLDKEVPIEWFVELLDVISDTEFLDWQLLTKRPQNWRSRLLSAEAKLAGSKDDRLFLWIDDWLKGGLPENIWIGVSAGADHEAALEIPAPIHFLSCEPMLRQLEEDRAHITQKFDWIIFGGESGPDSRECKQSWLRHGLEFCKFYEIPAFVKQLGAFSTFFGQAGRHGQVEYRAELKDSHGGDMSEWPEELRVREFPTAHRAVATAKALV